MKTINPIKIVISDNGESADIFVIPHKCISIEDLQLCRDKTGFKVKVEFKLKKIKQIGYVKNVTI